MAGVVTASEPSWTAPFTGLSARDFRKLMTALRCEGVEMVRPGRRWSLPLEDRVLLVATYWRTNLTLRQIAPLLGVSKSDGDRIIDRIGPQLALKPRRRFREDTVLIVEGTPVPTRDHTLAEPSKKYSSRRRSPLLNCGSDSRPRASTADVVGSTASAWVNPTESSMSEA